MSLAFSNSSLYSEPTTSVAFLKPTNLQISIGFSILSLPLGIVDRSNFQKSRTKTKLFMLEKIEGRPKNPVFRFLIHVLSFKTTNLKFSPLEFLDKNLDKNFVKNFKIF